MPPLNMQSPARQWEVTADRVLQNSKLQTTRLLRPLTKPVHRLRATIARTPAPRFASRVPRPTRACEKTATAQRFQPVDSPGETLKQTLPYRPAHNRRSWRCGREFSNGRSRLNLQSECSRECW